MGNLVVTFCFICADGTHRSQRNYFQEIRIRIVVSFCHWYTLRQGMAYRFRLCYCSIFDLLASLRVSIGLKF